MAYALGVDFVEPDRSIRMSLTFWGRTEREAEAAWRDMQTKFEFFVSAHREGRTIEEMEEVDDDELPEVDDGEDEEDDE
jgi:hypothetical protein